MRVVLGVSGGIAAYKACSLLRLFTEHGHDVTVVPTAAALRFVGAPTWSALSGKPVSTEVWTSVHEVPHVRIGQAADLVVVAPTTADVLAKAAHGLADDLLTNTLLTARCPVAYAPAMHTEMWEHPATQANVATLRARGAHVIEPAVGRLTGKDTGAGRLPEPEQLYAACLALVDAGRAAAARTTTGRTATGGATVVDLQGRRVVVSAGGTREPLDPVRYISNHSSGKMGVAIAAAAWRRGADVTLVAGPLQVAPPPGVPVVPVDSTQAMADAVAERLPATDLLVMAAAPADFRAAEVAEQKIKRGDGARSIALAPTADILASTRARRKPGALIVGFALETTDVVAHARAKLAAKGLDLVVLNDATEAGAGFGVDTNRVTLIGSDGALEHLPLLSKHDVADVLLDRVEARLDGR